ncbi:hypothetical protein [Rickettsiella massiliensis]|uniref:hypothetical protein n=1 Tax=Rickettsiella massiliensis TaxID=676517 RepID=UPI00029A5445|nr:hypothetical protein [Rickettsiella massiliensis]
MPVSDLVEINPTNFAPTDIFVTPVNETNDAIQRITTTLKRSLVAKKALQKFLLLLGSQKNLWAHLYIPRNTWKDGKDKTATDDSVPLLIQCLLTYCNK